MVVSIRLSIGWMGAENLIYALADVPQKVEKLMRAMDESYDNLYKSIISYRGVKLFYPRLILGASDEVPPPADIERVRYISEYCKI